MLYHESSLAIHLFRGRVNLLKHSVTGFFKVGRVLEVCLSHNNQWVIQITLTVAICGWDEYAWSFASRKPKKSKSLREQFHSDCWCCVRSYVRCNEKSAQILNFHSKPESRSITVRRVVGD
jgi:hypothetical protein